VRKQCGKAIVMAILVFFAAEMQMAGQAVDAGSSATANYLPMWETVSGSPYTIQNSQVYDAGVGTGVGINTTYIWSYQQMLVPSVTSTSENCFEIAVSDAFTNSSGAGDYFRIQNSTAANGVFAPALIGHIEDGTTDAPFKSPISIIGSVSPTDDATTTPIITFDARRTSAQISNRNLFNWSNFGTSQMAMDPTGSLGIGTTTPAARLDVEYSTSGSAVSTVGYNSEIDALSGSVEPEGM